MYETIETKCVNDRGMLLYVSLSLFLTRAFLSNIVEYILCSTLDDDDGYNASVPETNTHTNSFLSFQFKSIISLFSLNRT
jgi:hypothetical protein